MADEGLSSGFIPSLFKPSSLLPIAKHREALLYTVETYPITIIIGQTGSGKTTQLPQFLEQGGWCNDGKVIAVTQPRRVAATSVATRVAEEMNCNVGEEVGYSIRFEDVTSAKTRIKFLTDGLLLREAMVDPLLSRYSVIMVDEAHERSLSTDILLGILKKIRRRRPELRIIISSATLQAEEFLDFFTNREDSTNGDGKDNADATGKIFYLSGRSYPVDIQHLESPCEDYLTLAVSTIFSIHGSELPGDVLVFLTGAEEITNAVQSIADRSLDLPSHAQHLLALPLYAGLPTEAQLSIFDPAPANTRKVILATNIAEASLTIPGIVYVLDSGFVKQRAYNPLTGISTLTTVPISAASAVQRAGRAGRTKAGKCYRLYTESAFRSLPAQSVPEIQRADLAPTILQLKALGIDNIARFGFLTPPPSVLVTRALELLYSLGALDEYAKLTRPVGARMAEMAIEPQMARALLSAGEKQFGCLSEMLTIAAMSQLGGSVWVDHGGDSRKAMDRARRRFAAEEGDHLTLLNVYAGFVGKGRKEARWCHENYLNYKSLSRAASVRGQLKRYLERFGMDVSESLDARKGVEDARKGVEDARKGVEVAAERPMGERIRRCLTSGFFAQAAKMQGDGSLATVNGGTTLWAHPTSLMFNRKAEWVVFGEVVETGGGKRWIRDVSKIERGWLVEYGREYYSMGG